MSAQEEFERLVNSNREVLKTHPEDRNASETESEEEEKQDEGQEQSDNDSDYADSIHDDRRNMGSRTTTTYTVPTTVFEANTGPKGVIADAQSYERERRKTFRRTLLDLTGLDLSKKTDADKDRKTDSNKDKIPLDADDEEFMQRWREKRMRELSQQQNHMRRNSPSKRLYGTVDEVDAEGYLNAIERVPPDTTVVVCIFDPDSSLSEEVEEALTGVARLHQTVHFVKLHYEIAEMNHLQPPALLAYRAGELISTLVELEEQVGRGKITVTSIEHLLKRQNII
ncbi:hypothetical protein VTN31DRAFT_4478 [Thermomyces dupontii]|uniref:uncharacterized protein n=1 Tax=Talaromyces thermophilus TaxID=28565 RepID=UPI0037448C1A